MDVAHVDLEMPEADPDVVDVGDGSALDRIRERRERLREERHLDLDVPGYGGDLVVRYRPIEREEMRKLAGRLQRRNTGADEELSVQVDLLARCCREVMVRTGGELSPIDPDSTEPVVFDDRLASALGFTAKNAREAVLGVFCPNPEDTLPLSNHANTVLNWMRREDDDVDEELLGK